MPTAFLDTSAVVKRYDTREAGAARVLAICDPAFGNTLVLADVTSPEVAAALARKRRLGELTASEHARLWAAFELHREGGQYDLVPLGRPVYSIAERLAPRHPLRGFDAVQVACALHARSIIAAIDPDFTFVTADHRQATAAQSEGLAVELVV